MKYQMAFKQELVNLLIEANVIQCGTFTLKSGETSDIYFDARQLYSHPKLLDTICIHLLELINKQNINRICGVPYGAIPFVSIMSLKSNIPMIVLRKERKEYGMKNIIEGEFCEKDSVVLVEDVVTTGSSIKESVEKLKENNLFVVQKIAIINRSKDNSIISLVTEQDIKSVIYIPKEMKNRKFVNPMATKLWNIILSKNTNLCLSADVGILGKLIEIAELLGDHICMLKIHWDCIYIEPIYKDSLKSLYKIAKEKQFLILDDRKYADIESIVSYQFCQSNCCDGVTVHSIFGQGTINGIKDQPKFYNHEKGIFLIAQSSAKDNLIDKQYTQKTIELAKENKDYVAGFICQNDFGDSSFLHLTPGIHLNTEENGTQTYKTPRQAVEMGTDVIIVGRGIYSSSVSLLECLKYKHSGWNALVDRYRK